MVVNIKHIFVECICSLYTAGCWLGRAFCGVATGTRQHSTVNDDTAEWDWHVVDCAESLHLFLKLTCSLFSIYFSFSFVGTEIYCGCE